MLGRLGAAMMLAQFVGTIFAIVAVNPIYPNPFEDKIRELGWEKCALTNRLVRTLPAPAAWDSIAAACTGKPDAWLEMFDNLAYEYVQEGGDVIICVFNPGAAQLALNGYREVRDTGVPVIFAPAAMVKLAEMMVALRRSINPTKSESPIGTYQSLAPEMLNELHAMGGKLFG